MSATASTESTGVSSPAPLLSALRGAVCTLRTEADPAGARSWQPAERESAIVELDALIQELTVYRGRVLVAHKEDGRWGSARDRDYVDWRSRMTGSGRGPAAGELAVAEGLEVMPEVARAVDSGALSIEHAKTLARMRADASEEVKQALDDGVTAELVEHAKRRKLSAPELAKEARRQAASIDAQAAQTSYDATWRRRSVSFGKSAGGGRSGQWLLDDVGGTIVETALDTVAGPVAADDSRTRKQRHADALVIMASRTLQVGADLNGAQVRPHVALVVGEDTWAAAQAHQAAVDASTGENVEQVQRAGAAFGLRPDGAAASVETVDAAASGCAVFSRSLEAPALPDVEPAELEDGTIVPLRELLRLMCDCQVTRMVMTAESVPLDVGLTQRTYTRELRRAVTTRDRTCQWPGCTIRAAWSEVHHIVWYSRGGPTSVRNAATLCTYHHHVVHNENVRIVPLKDGFAFYRADGSLIGTRRRSPRRRRTQTPDEDRRSPQPPAGARELLDAWERVRTSDGRERPALPAALRASPPARGDRMTQDRQSTTDGGASRGEGGQGTPPGQEGPPHMVAGTPGNQPIQMLWDVADAPDQPSEPPF